MGVILEIHRKPLTLNVMVKRMPAKFCGVPTILIRAYNKFSDRVFIW